MKRIIALCLTVVLWIGVTGAPFTIPCRPDYNILQEQNLGCTNLWKKETVNVYWEDGHSTNISSEGTGRCGTHGSCTNCEVPTTKECWPRFFTPCRWSDEIPPSTGCYIGYWSQTVVSQNANTGTYTCPVSGCSITQTSCQDGASFTYTVSHTCWACG